MNLAQALVSVCWAVIRAAHFLDDAARERLREKTRATFPVRRMGTIEDIGNAAVFLMTNPYVTGTALEVSGGEPLVSLDV